MADVLTTQSATPATIPATTKIATREVTYSGDASTHIAPVGLVAFSGADDAKTAADIPGDAANGLDVDVTRLPALPTGTNSIGDVRSITTSVIPGTSATHLGKAEDAVAGSGETGVMALGVRNTALATRTSADGDYSALSVSERGEVLTQVTQPLPAGTNVVGDIANIGTSVTPGTSPAHLGKAEDAAHTSGDVGVMALGVRKDTAVALAGTDGDYMPLVMDAVGRLHTTLSGNIRAALGAKATVTITLTSLGNGSARESTVLDFSSSGAIDALLRVTTNGQASGTGRLDLYAYAALGDTTYTDGATGSDAAFTAANRLNARYIGFVQMNQATAVVGAFFSLAAAFDGTLPSKVGLIAINSSGAALSATGGDHVVEVQTLVLAA